MIVGDYARKADEGSKQALSGFYNRKLDDNLKAVDYGVDKCYLTCFVKLYIKGLGSGNWKYDEKLLKQMYEEYQLDERFFLHQMVEEINQIQPLVVVVMGEYALRALTGKQGIGKWRGSVLSFTPEIQHYLHNPNIRIVASLHIADIQTDETNIHLIRFDFKKAIELLYNPTKPTDSYEVTIFKNSGELIRWIDQYDKPKEMATDIETRFGFITCAGISFDGYRGGCIPLIGDPNVDVLEKCRMAYVLSKMLADRNIGKGNQNINYDKRIYERFGFHVTPVVWDTMLASNVIATEFPKRLGFLTSIYTDLSYYKDDGRQEQGKNFNYEQYYTYNAKDAISAYQIWQKQKADLIELDLLDFFEKFIMPLFDIYFSMEHIGWKIDLSKRNELAAKYETFYNIKYIELTTITEKPINLDSPLQIGTFMLENGFPCIMHRTDGGKQSVSTGLNELKKMKTYDPHKYKDAKIPYEQCLRFIDLVLLLRRIDKVIQYVQVGIHPQGRVFTSCNLAGTGNGRTSGSQTPDQAPYWHRDKKGELGLKMKDLGQSFQTVTKHGFIIEGEEDLDDIGETIGKDLREMYVPDSDYIIIECDGSQAEARVVDVLSEDWEGLAEYGKIDKHCKVASLIYTEYTYEDIVRLAKKEKTEQGLYMRFIGKKGKHANNLGVGEYVLSLTANIPIGEARKILVKLDKAYPNTKLVFHAGVENAIRETRLLYNSFGRKRFFYKKIDPHYLKVGYSWIPQSTISDNTKRAMLIADSHPKFDRSKMHFIAENHDSVTALVKRGVAHLYCHIIKKAMETPIDMRKCVLPRDIQLKIPAEFSVGRKNWGSIKECKKLNLDRLKDV